MIELMLNGKWKMKATEDNEWFDTTVPGSVMTTLLQQGKIDDPFYRDNEEHAYDIAKRDYEFTRDFDVSAELLEQDYILLRCEGLDTLSDIIINGEKIASTNNMHRLYEFDLKGYLKEGKNKIYVKLYSPIAYIANKNAKQPIDGVEHAIEGYQYMRKAHSMFGWDWGPKIPDLGIWRNIALIGWSSGRITDMYVRQYHKPDRVDLDVQVALEKFQNENLELNVTITSPDGSTMNKSVDSVNLKENIKMTIDNPKLWWPNGFGSQPLYAVNLTLKKEGKTLDNKELNLGLRTVDVRQEPDAWGESFEFVVNGISIFAMGANYIPEDSLLPRITRERTEQLIKDSAEANFNMIRVWGGGYYPDDYFYDLCDRYGLIVWQDFMFACSVYDLTEEFEETIKQEAIDNIKRIRHHASLGLWCGNNEVEEAWENWGWPKRSKFRTHYLKLFEIILPDLIEKLDPQTFYWPSSPSSGGAFDNPKDHKTGDVHYWEVWHGLKPFTEYRKYNFRFCSEFGFQSFPSFKTVKSFTKSEDRNVFSYVMEKHQKNGGANGKILSYLSDTFLYPKDFDSLLYTSQLLQAEAIKYGVEHWRRNRGISMGSIYWQLNDCWPVASWSSIDYFGRWKALHYFAKRFYAPVLLSIKEEGVNAELHITNDTMNKLNGKVEWKLRTNRGEVLQEGKISKDVEPLSATLCESLSFEDSLDKRDRRSVYFEATLYVDNDEVSTATVLFTQPKHFEFLNPDLETHVEGRDDHYEIVVSADTFTKYVELDLQEADCKFSDNYFDISVGDKRMIKVQKDSLSDTLDLHGFRKQLKVRSLFHITD